MSIACTHVIHSARPILFVWRDAEGLGMACGHGDHDPDTIDDWGMAHTFHFTGADPAMGIVHTLAVGDAVTRARVGAPWVRVVPVAG
jgi:hypothetical protein